MSITILLTLHNCGPLAIKGRVALPQCWAQGLSRQRTWSTSKFAFCFGDIGNLRFKINNSKPEKYISIKSEQKRYHIISMADQHCKKGDKILYITPAPAVPPEVSQLQETVGSEGAVKIISRTQITGGTSSPHFTLNCPMHALLFALSLPPPSLCIKCSSAATRWHLREMQK
jgi:hypothetical protein